MSDNKVQAWSHPSPQSSSSPKRANHIHHKKDRPIEPAPQQANESVSGICSGLRSLQRPMFVRTWDSLENGVSTFEEEHAKIQDVQVSPRI